MIRHFRTTAILTATVVLAGLIGLTQVSCNKNVGEDAGEDDHAGHDHVAQDGTFSADDAEAIHEEVIAALNLPEAQQQQVRAIFAAFRADVAAWTVEHEAESNELREVLKKFHGPRDDTTSEEIQAAMARLIEIQGERAAKDEALLDDLREVLTPEQVVTAESVLYPVPPEWAETTVNRFHLLTKMGLTEEQLAEVEAIMDEAKEAMESSDEGTSGGEIMQVAWQRIVDDVLTEENHEQMRNMIQKVEHQRMVVAMFGQLRLTADQSERIGVLWDEAYEQATADPAQKYEIYYAVQQDILQNVLTAEQRAAFEEAGAAGGHGHGG